MPTQSPSESIASLDSDSSRASDSDGDGYESDDDLRLAQLEWEENLRQLQLLFSVVLLPYVGKWLGRRWAHSFYARYTQFGWTRALFFRQPQSS